MKTQNKKLITILDSVIASMKIDTSPIATYYREFLEYKLGQLNGPHEIAEIAQNIINAYGGMGTLNDINIYKGDESLLEENIKFHKLLDDLQDLCEDIIVEDRNK